MSIADFCNRFSECGLEVMTTKVFSNRQRTSVRNGILKAEAVFEFASVLQRHKVDILQNVTPETSEGLEDEIKKIPGQKVESRCSISTCLLGRMSSSSPTEWYCASCSLCFAGRFLLAKPNL